MPHKQVLLLFPGGSRITGQRAATFAVGRVLKKMRFPYRFIEVPVVSEKRDSAGRVLLLFSIMRYWIRWLFVVRANSVVYLNLGQSLTALLRDGVPYLMLRGMGVIKKSVISLHGHWFVGWDESFVSRKLMFAILRYADVVTVLGAVQKESLISWGINADQVRIIHNTCDIPLLRRDEVQEKHKEKKCRVLYLSNLVDTKGYIELLDALTMIADDIHLSSLEVIICGQFMKTGYSKKKTGENDEHYKWFQERLSNLKKSGMNIRWLPGAYGVDKAELFHSAHIFVLPSHIEGQPIVLLEAMASGCCILASKVGEIPYTLGHTGVLFSEISSLCIADVLRDHINQHSIRLDMGLATLERYVTGFDTPIHDDLWVDVFNCLCS